MPVDITVPTMGESVVEATVGKWLKTEGEAVATGDALVELETDKVNQELAADQPGTLQQILRREGETVHPGDVLAVFTPDDAAASGTDATRPRGKRSLAPPSGNSEHRTPDTEHPAPTPPPAALTAEQHVADARPTPETTRMPQGEAERIHASPLAERIAEDLDVDLADVPASGPGGRITREDVESFASRPHEPATPSPHTEHPTPNTERLTPSVSRHPTPDTLPPRPQTRRRLSRRRLTIARRLVEAQQTAAMLTTFNEVDMSAVMALRARRRDAFKERHGVGLGYMSFFTKATVGALKAFPQLNSELQGDELVLKDYHDIGIAIGDPEGLVVPVVRNADRLTFAEIEKAIEEFVRKARDRALTLEDLQGGTFTITNGGVYGSLLSTPILNPPQVGVLGMHKIQERPVVIPPGGAVQTGGGEVGIRPMMYLALTYDHRVVDGREAVQFLVRLKELLEEPERLLLEG